MDNKKRDTLNYAARSKKKGHPVFNDLSVTFTITTENIKVENDFTTRFSLNQYSAV